MEIEGSVDPAVLTRAKIQMGNLQYNVGRLVGLHKAKYQEEEIGKEVSGKDLDNLFQSPKALKMQTLLQSPPPSEEISLHQVSGVRNYLLCKIISTNLIRPCALYHVPLALFTAPDISPDTETGLYTFPLFFDKTVRSTGQVFYLHLTGMLTNF